MKTSESNYGECLYFVSNALARKVEKLAIDAWKPVGLSPSHAYLLMLVIGNPGLQPTEISEQLHLTPSTITRLVEKLEEKGLVVRTSSGKITHVYPSPKGKGMLNRMKDCVSAFSNKYSRVLGKEETSSLVDSMGRVADKLEA